VKPSRNCRGFSLIEVLVALIVIAVGMLGIAKMHALALSTTGSAGTRSLVAIEAAGLAAAMHANRDYWTATPNLVTNVNVAAGVATIDPASALSSATTCATAVTSWSPASSCTTTSLAAYDVQSFGSALAQVVPAANASIACQNATPPQSCTVTVTWVENIASMNSTTSSAAISSAAVGAAPSANLIQQPQFTLYVEP
jgi:type IV pilus assembly protein PilV